MEIVVLLLVVIGFILSLVIQKVPFFNSSLFLFMMSAISLIMLVYLFFIC